MSTPIIIILILLFIVGNILNIIGKAHAKTKPNILIIDKTVTYVHTFEHPEDTVYTTMLDTISTLKGTKLVGFNPTFKIIECKFGVSVWSFGEKVTIQITSTSDGETEALFASTPIVGSIDYALPQTLNKHSKNIERIIAATFDKLPPFVSKAS